MFYRFLIFVATNRKGKLKHKHVQTYFSLSLSLSLYIYLSLARSLFLTVSDALSLYYWQPALALPNNFQPTTPTRPVYLFIQLPKTQTQCVMRTCEGEFAVERFPIFPQLHSTLTVSPFHLIIHHMHTKSCSFGTGKPNVCSCQMRPVHRLLPCRPI